MPSVLFMLLVNSNGKIDKYYWVEYYYSVKDLYQNIYRDDMKMNKVSVIM